MSNMSPWGKIIVLILGLGSSWIIWHGLLHQNFYTYILVGGLLVYLWRKYVSHKAE